MTIEEHIKLFGMSTILVESALTKVEKAYQCDLTQQPEDVDRDPDYYPQFSRVLRTQAATMARHYEVFYCLEASIRNIVAETLKAVHGETWWASCVPQAVQDNVFKNMQREVDSAVTVRSEDDIDFTTFGELGEIVRANWTEFGSTFSSEKAFTKIMTNLNLLRGPIAHCCPLAPDEVERLKLTVRDWFRLME